MPTYTLKTPWAAPTPVYRAQSSTNVIQSTKQLTLQDTFQRSRMWGPTHSCTVFHNQRLVRVTAVIMKPSPKVEDLTGYFAHWETGRLLKDCVGRRVNLTTDKRTSRQVQEYIPVTARWSVKNVEGSLVRHKRVLDVSGFKQSHTL